MSADSWMSPSEAMRWTTSLRRSASRPAQYLGRLRRFEMREHDGDDLRMLVRDHVGDRLRRHPLERVEALAATAVQDAIDQALRALAADRVRDHLADVLVHVNLQRRLRVHGLREAIHDVGDLLAGDAVQRGHRGADLLDLARVHELEHGGRVRLAEAHEEHGGALAPGELSSGRLPLRDRAVARRSRVLRHRSTSSASRPARRGADPPSATLRATAMRCCTESCDGMLRAPTASI